MSADPQSITPPQITSDRHTFAGATPSVDHVNHACPCAPDKPEAKAQRAEARRAEMDALQERLSAQVEALRDSQEWERYLRFCAAFHAYSARNLMLIMLQCPTATTVAGYRPWQKLGRQVRKGEKGIRIIGGRTVEVPDEDDEDKTKRHVRYYPTSVFDIGQTEPIPGVEDQTATAQPAKDLHGEDQHGIYRAVAEYLTGQGWTVRRGHIDGTASGYTAPDAQEVVIGDHLSDAHAAKTALHEAAHITLGHVEEDAYEEYVTHRGRCEVEAESVAFILAGSFGLDTSDYSTGYVAVWAHDATTDLLQDTAERVRTAAQTLRDRLDHTDPAFVAA